MHPRIRKLAEQTNVFMADEGGGMGSAEYCPNEKEIAAFAEAIIRECSNILDDGNGEMSSMAENVWKNICRDIVLNHFNLKK